MNYNGNVELVPQNGFSVTQPMMQKGISNNNLVQLLEAADSAANRNYLMTCSNCEVAKVDDKLLDSGLYKSEQQISLFKLSRLVYSADENPAEKLKSFFLAFSGMEIKSSIFYLIQNECVKLGEADDGSENEYAVSLYVGIKPRGFSETGYNAEISKKMLQESFSGTFLGCAINEVSVKELKEIKSIAHNNGNVDVVCVSAQPSVRKDADEKTVDQGLEHFIDVMRNRKYTAMLLATPVDEQVVQERKRELENFYSKLSLFQKVSVAFGENESSAVGSNVSKSTTVTESNGKSFTETQNQSTTTNEGGSSTHGSSSSSGGNGFSSGSSSSYTSTWGRSETIGFSTSAGTTHSVSNAVGETSGTSTTDTKGSSLTNTIEVQNKGVVDLLEQLDLTLKKIKKSESFGLWECAAYFISDTYEESMFAANTFKALVLGDNSDEQRSHTIHWGKPVTEKEHTRQKDLCNCILSAEHPIVQTNNEIFRNVIPTSLVNGQDLAYFMCLPHKSVPGLAVDTIAAFERSVVVKSGQTRKKHSVIVDFGNVCHMDRKELPVALDLNDFTKHCFVTGSTGSGKSNTTELILQRCIENNINFLVVEPAKGEYKKSFKNAEGINIFTTHPLCESLLHINPFKFQPGIHVLEHIDRLLGIFSSCWELTAAMPAILKKAVEQSYQVAGWDLANSYFIGDSKEYVYPTFASLVIELRNVINSSSYSAEAKGNYTGALVTRVESLTAGVLKQIFCNEYDIPAKTLFDSRTIVDLSRLGSAETKTLIMGVLVMALSEHRQMNTIGTNKKIHHLTVIEEAHNLLRNSADSGSGGSDLIRKSVEMMSNAIAEMRTYGEGFLIVDQSPTAVDISAIKNTNTKIVMRLPEQHDCEAMANAMGLDEFQQKEIAKFQQGVAVVMQNDWTSAVLVKVAKSNPPAGEEEWVDPKYNRYMRSIIALALCDIGRRRMQYYLKRHDAESNMTEEFFKSIPTMKNITAQLVSFGRNDYLKLVGASRFLELIKPNVIAQISRIKDKWQDDWDALCDEVHNGRHTYRNLIEKYEIDVSKYPIPVGLKNIAEMVRRYAWKYKLWRSESADENIIGFGRLAIAVLGCEESWKILLNAPLTKQNFEGFSSILKKYMPLNDQSLATLNFNVLVAVVISVFRRGFIIEMGGTLDDVKKFTEAVRKNKGKTDLA